MMNATKYGEKIRPRRVLMTADTVGGVWTYALDLAAGLGEQGVEVVLATMGGPLDAARRREVERLDGVTVYESAFRLEWMNEPWSDVDAAGAWLLDLAARTDPDLVHLNGYAHAAWPWEVPVLVVGHSCVFSWFDAVRGCAPDASWHRYGEVVRAGLQAADLVTAPTAAMLEALRRHYGAFRSAGVVYNGRRLATPASGAKEPIILTAGRLWDEAKNTAALARVAPTLPWPVYVAGEERSPEGRTVALEGVERLGRLAPAALAAWMRRAALYALPARYEPFGLTALEAARSGCALVLGDIDSLRELWDGAAAFVPPGDDDALRRALNYLCQDDAARHVLADKARVRALTFSYEHMVGRYLDLYGQLLQGGLNATIGRGARAGAPASTP